MEFINSVFANQSSSLKTEIKKRLKTFSQIKDEYKINGSIYRTGRSETFSENAEKFGLPGVTKARISEHPKNDHEKPKEEINEPVWFTPYLEVAKDYCYKELENWKADQKIYQKLLKEEEFIKKFPKPSECETYEYIPKDISDGRNKQKILFLDLTKIPNTGNNGRFFLDGFFMKKIYDIILQKIAELIFIDEEYPSDEEKRWLCVDKPCNNPVSIKEFRDTYGYIHGLRDSEMYIDRFFTVELFKLLKELNIERDNNCIIMGYFHGDIHTGKYEKEGYDIDGFFPAEFTIQQRNIINKFRIKHTGLVTSTSQQTRKRKRDLHDESSMDKKKPEIKKKAGNKKKEKRKKTRSHKNKKKITIT